ncbi:unnamed protein product [Scomber scombrus]|uniref:Unnamed protein product n=1 Tax=Scomber scombrus TaxID=13677 RepID=A0AAV1NHY1_SCOSC
MKLLPQSFHDDSVLFRHPENVIVKLRPIILYEELSFTELEQVVDALKMTETATMDQLYEEFYSSCEEIQKAGQDTTESTSEKGISLRSLVKKFGQTVLFQLFEQETMRQCDVF